MAGGQPSSLRVMALRRGGGGAGAKRLERNKISLLLMSIFVHLKSKKTKINLYYN
jgi:hypothetical protein